MYSAYDRGEGSTSDIFWELQDDSENPESGKDISSDEDDDLSIPLNYSVSTEHCFQDSTEESFDEEISFWMKSSWYSFYYLRHNLTELAMEELLKRDFPRETRYWKTVRSKIQYFSRIKLQYH